MKHAQLSYYFFRITLGDYPQKYIAKNHTFKCCCKKLSDIHLIKFCNTNRINHANSFIKHLGFFYTN